MNEPGLNQIASAKVPGWPHGARVDGRDREQAELPFHRLTQDAGYIHRQVDPVRHTHAAVWAVVEVPEDCPAPTKAQPIG